MLPHRDDDEVDGKEKRSQRSFVCILRLHLLFTSSNASVGSTSFRFLQSFRIPSPIYPLFVSRTMILFSVTAKLTYLFHCLHFPLSFHCRHTGIRVPFAAISRRNIPSRASHPQSSRAIQLTLLRSATMPGDPNQADSNWASPYRNATSTDKIVREMEMMAKRFEGSSHPSRPARTVAQPQEAVRARKASAQVTPHQVVQDLHPDRNATPAVPVTFTSATSQTHLDQPHALRKGLAHTSPQPEDAASTISKGAATAPTWNDAALTDSTCSIPPLSIAPQNAHQTSSMSPHDDYRKVEHCYSEDLLDKPKGRSHSGLSASEFVTTASTRLPDEADSAENDNDLATLGMRSTALSEKISPAESNRARQSRRAAFPEMEETDTTSRIRRAAIPGMREGGATPPTRSAAPVANQSSVTTQDATFSAQRSQSYLSDSTASESSLSDSISSEPSTGQPPADQNLARASRHTILPRLPIASWTDNRMLNIIKNQSISIFNEAGNSTNPPIPTSAPAEPSAHPFTALGRTIQYLMDVYSVILSWVIRYNWRLVPLIILTLSFLLSWTGDMTYPGTVKHVIKYCMCHTSIFKSWDICASVLPSTSIPEESLDRCEAAHNALSLVHNLAIISELFAVAKPLEQAHHKLFMFSVEANDPDLITLSQNYIQNSDILREQLQDFLTNITVTIQWIEYLTSELANDLTYTISNPPSEIWLVYVWRWISFDKQLTAVNVTELHTLYTDYLTALIETTNEQIIAHIRISNSFEAIHNVIHPLSAKTNKAHPRIASTIEQHKSSWLLEWLRPSQSSNELDEKAVNIELLRTYLDQAAPKLEDARQGLEGTKGTLKALLRRAVQPQQKMSVRWHSNVDRVWSDVQYILTARTGIEAVKDKVAKRKT